MHLYSSIAQQSNKKITQMQKGLICRGKTYLWIQIFFSSAITILLITTSIPHVVTCMNYIYSLSFNQGNTNSRQVIATHYRITNFNFNYLLLHSQFNFHSLNHNSTFFPPHPYTPPPTPVPLPSKFSLKPARTYTN